MIAETLDMPAQINIIRETAADWVVRLHEAEGDEKLRLEQECQHWLAQHPQHQKIFGQMSTMWDAASCKPATKKRHVALSAACCVLLLSGLSMYLPWQYWLADYRTAKGEIKTILLDDGSQLILNSYSAVNVDYSSDFRTIYLQQGEVLAQVEKDAAKRPFRVVSRDGDATALGTRYSVRMFEQYSRAAVQESVIAVTPQHKAVYQTNVNAGQMVTFSGYDVTLPENIDHALFSWTKYRLTFVDRPLTEVLDELALYHKGLLRLQDSADTRELRFTGILPSNDINAALALLAETFELDITRVTPYLVFISAS